MGSPSFIYDPETLGVTQAPVADPVELEYDAIEADDIEEMALARIPLSRNPRKAAYLSNRSMGFSIRESCNLTEISFRTLLRWRQSDTEFVELETNRLGELQKSIAADVLRMGFMRNMSLALKRDGRVLKKAVYDFSGLTPREFDYLKIIRKHYTPQDLIAIDRATEPDPETAKTEVHGNLNIYVDNRLVESEEAKRAATRQLLERFTRNQELVGVNGPSDTGTAPDS